MSVRLIEIESASYRIVISRTPEGFRGFWFCPHPDCFAAYRAETPSTDKEAAILICTKAAREHQQQTHRQDTAGYYPETAFHFESPRLPIRG